MRWTDAQRAAIDARNGSVLVSAAAGSGKTAVLVERVLSLLREGGRIDRMLIVTFTRAAAGEMRERIGRRLEQESAQNPHLRRQALRLHRAAICTLHVFCGRVLREHFQAAGVDPLARVADEDMLRRLYRKAQDEAMEEAYASGGEDERALFSQFEDEQVAAMTDELYRFLMAQEDPWEWARAHCEAAGSIDHFLPLLREAAAEKLAGAQELIPEMADLLSRPDGPARYQTTFECDSAMTRQMAAEAAAGVMTGGKTSFARLSTKRAAPEENPELAEQYKALREEWKERVNDARALLPADPNRAEEDLRHTQPALRALIRLTRSLHEKFFALKQKRNYLDYSDLEHLTLKALENPDVRSAVAGSFDALFIDEYQDVSGIQEAILRSLHAGMDNTLFMVGDVKQSIYRFRLADPTLFLRKYQDYAADAAAGERKILLQQNFRSDENVLRAVNDVFVHAMREKETEIDYDDAAALRPGGGRPFGAPVEIHLITAPREEDGDDGELTGGYRWEAAFVARRIRELMRDTAVREGDGERPLRFRDIALLLRYASNRAPYIARALQLEGIPVYSDADAQFFDMPDVVDLMNLLRVIDNPLQDVPLLSVLRCPCFAFTEEELARIRLLGRTPGTPFYEAYADAMETEGPLGDKTRKTWDTLAWWRFLSRNMPVDKLIWRVLDESGLYMRAGALEEGELRQANLRMLVERAQGDIAREGLGVFLRETGRIRASDDGKTARTLGENEDVVRILTLHKSKGLEIPVVFMMEMARSFRKSSASHLRLHARCGMALQYIDAERRVTRETCAARALSVVGEKEARAEEARLLYVGMTRARERLILVGSPRRLDRALASWSRPASAYAAGHADCMLDWVLTALGGFHAGAYTGKSGSVWQMALEPAEALSAPSADRVAALPPLGTEPADERTLSRMTRTEKPRPPLKTSVTAIAKILRDEKDDWESPADKRRLPEEAPKPSFLEEKRVTPAEKGTVTHRVLGQMDLEMARVGKWEEALDALQRQGVLSDEERKELRMEWIQSFFASPLGRRALAAQTLHREWSFNLRGEMGSMIQGVIDLCFLEDGQWVLADYKTDAADGGELLRRYALQLRWYARALAVISGIPVREVLIFSLRSGTCFPVPAS